MMTALKRMAYLLLFAALQSNANEQSPDITEIAEIKDSAISFLNDQITKEGYLNAKIEIYGIDSRLRMPKCKNPLSASFPPGRENIKSAIVIGVECASDKPWKIYVPAKITISTPTVIAKNPILKGRVITADDIEVDNVDTLKLSGFAIRSTDKVIGKAAKKNIKTGDIITAQSLAIMHDIKKGDVVTIRGADGRVEIYAEGIALEPGIVGGYIKVKNTSSGTVIDAKITGERQVESNI